ncbi:MAG: GNAT family N-acetyltransferase [Acidobacteriaceae bacterium]
MRIHLQLATAEDVAELVALRIAVNEHLAKEYGAGYWLSRPTEKGALFGMRNAKVYVARHRKKLVATLTLATKKPWAIDAKYFSKSERPLYLTNMAVEPGRQRRGLGRSCIAEARRIAGQWPGDAIRLDAYDTKAGAGEFYRKSGFQEVGRATYRGAPLIYFEMLM